METSVRQNLRLINFKQNTPNIIKSITSLLSTFLFSDNFFKEMTIQTIITFIQ
jgi:hypothetical protein